MTKGYFDNLQESELDSQRTEMYASENLRKKELVKATNLADYYKSLEINSKITKIQQSRRSQSHTVNSKTNQFNLQLFVIQKMKLLHLWIQMTLMYLS